MLRKKRKPAVEFTLYLTDEGQLLPKSDDEAGLEYDGFRVFFDLERTNELHRDDQHLGAPGLIFCRVAGVTHNSKELNHKSIRLGTVLALVPEPTNQFDPGAIRIVNPVTKGTVGYVPKELAAELAKTANVAGGGMAAVLGVWTKGQQNAALRVIGSIGRNFVVTTD